MTARSEKIPPYNVKNSKGFLNSPLNGSLDDLKSESLSERFKTFKLDDLDKISVERKSYEDLLDRCLEQERLLGFDESIKEEADKLIKEIENATEADRCSPKLYSLASPIVNCSEAGPITADEDINKAEIFQEAADFDFDYLSKIPGKSGHRAVRDSRESLFLKFDPLCKSSPTAEDSTAMAQPESKSGGMSTPKRAGATSEELTGNSPKGKHSDTASTNSAVKPKTRPSSGTSTPTLRNEILSKEISKLQDLMLKQESSYQDQISACTEEIEELRKKLAKLEVRDTPENAEEKLTEVRAEAEKLRKQVNENNDQKKQLMMIMEEYEKTISQVVTMREDDKKKFESEKEQLASERDEAVHHLRNMEIAFNDVHQKYEKCKEVIDAFKHNEVQYKLSLAENKKTIQQQEEKYTKLKEHATEKLEAANKEIAEIRRVHDVETAKLRAINKKMEIQVKTLEESIEQKKREVCELTKICDELITKVGS